MMLQRCQVCQQECKPLRCKNCRKAFYCSVNCQKLDWKAGHRRLCSAIPAEKVNLALRELNTIAHGLSLEQATENFYKATDAIKKTKEVESKLSTSSKPSTSINQNPKIDQDLKFVAKPKAKGDTLAFNPGFLTTKREPKNLLVADSFSFIVEEMKHISCFQVVLQKKADSQELDYKKNFELLTNRIDGSYSFLIFKEKEAEIALFAAELPRHLDSSQCTWKFQDKNSIQLRLKYADDPCAMDLCIPQSHSNPDSINQIQCRYCLQPLLPEKPIERACQLPAGHWDDIADYLICYSGQPVVDFSASSASAQQSVAMYDSNVLCLHQGDLGVSVCVLAVAGYGEGNETDEDKTGVDFLRDSAATVRGDRVWRDATGGATVCCSLCCSPLGFASIDFPESFRLLKHRLIIGADGTESKPFSTCASFLAREMVRYAEAKAIFNFVVALDSTSKSPFKRKCVLLRLVSWDSTIATTYEQSTDRLRFERVAKIVFEETYDKLAGRKQDDAVKWVWGGVDLCCAPEDGGIRVPLEQLEENPVGNISTVRMLLQQDEYDDMLQSLRKGSNLFSKTVAEATIMMKMGIDSIEAEGGLGLTAIALDNS